MRAEDARWGALVVLDRLTPPQRVAFVLHDAFGVPFEEIATVLGVSTPAARQHASRARRTVADADPAPPVDDAEHEQAVGRLVAALASGDLDAVVAALHPDVVAVGDANGTTSTALNVLHGPDRVARFYLGLLRRFGPTTLERFVPVRVNGRLGLWLPGLDGPTARASSPPRVGAFTVRDGLVAATYDVAAPEKLRGVRV